LTEQLDKLLIYQHVLKKDKLDIITNKIKPNSSQQVKIDELIKKREAGMPLAYVLGKTEFMGIPIRVDEHVLIPRDDTETLVEEVEEYINENECQTVLEIGTGSGCIAIKIAKLTNTIVTTIDISKKALRIARKNAEKNKVKMSFIYADIFKSLDLGKFDIIVSNPPYIPTKVIEELQPEVKNYEPKLALDGDVDGLKFYRRIAEVGKDLLNKNGKIFLEIGQYQERDIIKIFEDYKYLGYKKDLAGIIRVLKFGV